MAMKVGVIAGSPVDPQMGVAVLNVRNLCLSCCKSGEGADRISNAVFGGSDEQNSKTNSIGSIRWHECNDDIL